MKAPRIACLLALACAGSYLSSSAQLTEPIGTSSATQTATVTITTAGTLGSISVLTQGAIGLDFNAASGGTCSVGHSYAVGNTCTVNYTFKPTRPWVRYGGVALFDSSGNLLGNTYITGTGTGPQPIFPSNTSGVTVGGFIGGANGVAVDGNGNLYVANDGNVEEIVAVNGSIPAKPSVLSLGDGVHQAFGVAVDGSGNVYFADVYNNAVYELVAVNGTVPALPGSATAISLGSGFRIPLAVAVDGSGNVFVAGEFNTSIEEIVAVNGSIPPNPTINNLGSGFSTPSALAVDGSGDVFVADLFNDAVKEIVAVNGSIPPNPTINVLGSGFYQPQGVAVDGSGNVYVSDTGNSEVKEIVAVNGSIPANPTIKILGSGLVNPLGIAMSAKGNVFVGDTGNHRLAELNRADPPTLSFSLTSIGAASSPQSVTFQNNGNATLTGALSVSENWDQVTGSGTPADCGHTFSLFSGAECNLSLSFEPSETGPLTGTAIFTDNALNVTGAMQPIALSGTGSRLQLSVSATALAFGNLALGQQEDMSVQLTNTGTTSVTFAPTINGPSFTVPPSENGCGTVISAGHSCTFYVRFLPRTYGGHVDTLTLAAGDVTAPTVQLTGQTLGVGAEIGLLNFGTIPSGTTAILSVPIVNYAVAKNVTFSTSINGSSFKVLTAGNSCLSGITTAQQCAIPVEFSPSAAGDYANVLTITASSGDVSTVKLSGIASQP
jgi:sugar lactone lactonase YvrE